jgi:hypothetical protein
MQLTNEEAQEKLQTHLAADVEIPPELFASPRIVLLAESYADSTVTLVFWLTEQGVDITLRRYKAYKTAGNEIIVTVSKLYPLADVGNWVLGPGTRKPPKPPTPPLPETQCAVEGKPNGTPDQSRSPTTGSMQRPLITGMKPSQQ